MKNNPTRLDHIIEEGEIEFMDNGGLSIERRDQYFVRVVEYARQLERQLRVYAKQKRTNGERIGRSYQPY